MASPPTLASPWMESTMNAKLFLSLSLVTLLSACGGKGATCEEFLAAYEACAVEAVGDDTASQVTIEGVCDTDEADETSGSEWQCGIDAFEAADCSSISGLFDATSEADACEA